MLTSLREYQSSYGVVACRAGNHRATLAAVQLYRTIRKELLALRWEPTVQLRIFALSRINDYSHQQLYHMLGQEAAWLYQRVGRLPEAEPERRYGVICTVNRTRYHAYGSIWCGNGDHFFYHTQEQWLHLTAEQREEWIYELRGCPVYFLPTRDAEGALRARPGSVKILFSRGQWITIGAPRRHQRR